MMVPDPRNIAIPQLTVDEFLTRVRLAHWPDRLDGNAWQYGVDWDYMKEVADYWTTRLDWRKAEARLNAFPQFKALVDDFDIQFYHVQAVVLDLFGGSPEDAFDVVIPSLPGFGFSSKPERAWVRASAAYRQAELDYFGEQSHKPQTKTNF